MRGDERIEIVPRSESLAKLLFVVVALYVVLYSPTLAATRTGLARPLVLVGIIGIFVNSIIRPRPRARIPLAILVVCGGLLIALAGAQSLALLRGGDLYLKSLIVSVFSGLLPLTYLIVRFARQTPSVLERLARCLAWIGAFQSLLILADWSSPSVRNVLSSIVLQPEGIDSGFRAAGLTSMTGDGLSVSQAICAVCAIHLATVEKRWQVALGWMVALACILSTMVFVGRTGFVLVVMFTGYLVVLAPRRGRIVAGVIVVGALFAGAICAISWSIDDERLANLFDQATASAFEAVTGLGDGVGLHTVSTDDLASMIILPSSTETWLIGDGYYSSPVSPDSNYMGTDIGYLRLLFYVGVIGSAAIYAWYIAVIWWASRQFLRRADQVLGVGLVMCFFISQLKFNFLLLLAPLAVSSLIFFSALRERRLCE